MKFQDLFLVSWRQIVRHRRRYWGVILAITIGIGGLITVIMVSRDFKRNLSRDLDLVGGVTIVRAYYDNSLSSRPLLFQANTLEALRRLPGVQDASLMGFHTGWTKTSNGKKFLFSVMAVDEAFWGVRGFWAASGRLFGPETVTGRKRECVLGQALAEKSFGHSNVVGQTLEINNEPYLVLGVLGGITDSSLAGSVFLPRTTVQDRFAGLLLTDRIYLRCATLDDVAPVAAKIVEVVRNYQTDQHLHVEVIWEGLKRVQQIFWWAEFFIYVAIGATLLLGGLGIWNVMMAAVRSRTREIGLRKAVGANDADILQQFLTEAVTLSLVASLLGIVLGRLAVELLSYSIDSTPAENLFLTCTALGLVFGMLLGIAAGLLPSIRASRMEVVDAVRYE